MKRTLNGYWFYGNEVSGYGRENRRVDYATLAKAFDAVMCNSIMDNRYFEYEDWTLVNGYVDNSERIDEIDEIVEQLEQRIEELKTDSKSNAVEIVMAESHMRELQDERIDLLEEEYMLPDVYQYFIVSESGAEILKEWTDELVWYNDELDMYVWGVCHFGTHWSYVLTDIEIASDSIASKY